MKGKLVLLLLIGLMVIPFVAAIDFSLICPATVQPDGLLGCDLFFANNNEGIVGVSYSLSLENIQLFENPKSLVGISAYNSATGIGNFISTELLPEGNQLEFTFRAGESGTVLISNINMFNSDGVNVGVAADVQSNIFVQQSPPITKEDNLISRLRFILTQDGKLAQIARTAGALRCYFDDECEVFGDSSNQESGNNEIEWLLERIKIRIQDQQINNLQKTGSIASDLISYYNQS